MARITGLDPQARQPDRWNLALDGAFAFALDGTVVVREGLGVGQELTADDVERLRAAGVEQDLLSAALHFLGPRPRSRAEVRRRLMRPRARKAPPDEAMVERVLDRLAASQLVDDREFAAFWIENRERFNPRSARAMTVELRQLGVDRETAEAAIAPERDAERAVTAGERKLYALRGLDFDRFRERMGAFLLRRGFSYEVARVAVRELWARTGGDAASEDEAE